MSDLIEKEEVKALIKSVMPKTPYRSTLIHMVNTLESAKEPHKVNEEDVLKFYYCESEDEYYVGRRLNTMYYAKVNPKTFDKTFCMSRYLPWGKHIVDSETLWKLHTYPSEPKEIDFSKWLKGWCNKYLVAKEPQKQTFVTDLCENLELVKLHFGEEENQCLADEIIGTAIGTLKELDAKWRNNQPQVQPIVRTPEEIAYYKCCKACGLNARCERENQRDCDEFLEMIDWLTKKEV